MLKRGILCLKIYNDSPENSSLCALIECELSVELLRLLFCFRN